MSKDKAELVHDRECMKCVELFEGKYKGKIKGKQCVNLKERRTDGTKR